MDGIGNFISMVDYILDSKRKRHITGGILLSASLLWRISINRNDIKKRGRRE